MMRMHGLAIGAFLIVSTTSATAQDASTNRTSLMEGCNWKDQTVLINGKPHQKLSFRYQDCNGSYAPKVTFALDEHNALIQSSGDGASGTVAQFWTLAGRKPSAAVAEVASPSITANEKGRCLVHLDYVTGQYSYEPNAAYLEELLAIDEPFAACGDYGATNDSIQYFAVIDNTLLAFLWIGQDTPLFDPTSLHYQNSDKPGAVE